MAVLVSLRSGEHGLCHNHSRDRHGSIFDGAEWDGFGRVLFWQGWFSRVGVGCGLTSLVVGTVASSRTRRGMDLGQDGPGRLCFGGFCYVPAGHVYLQTTLLVSKRAAASVAEWDLLWFGTARNGSVSSV